MIADLLTYKYSDIKRNKTKPMRKDIVFNLIYFEQHSVVKLIENYWKVEQSLNTTYILLMQVADNFCALSKLDSFFFVCTRCYMFRVCLPHQHGSTVYYINTKLDTSCNLWSDCATTTGKIA